MISSLSTFGFPINRDLAFWIFYDVFGIGLSSLFYISLSKLMNEALLFSFWIASGWSPYGSLLGSKSLFLK